jgi:cation:H+ antiporter
MGRRTYLVAIGFPGADVDRRVAVGSVTVMAVGAHYFVTAVEHLSEEVGIPAGLIALVLAPLATALPEKFNSIIWVRDGKDTLASENIGGAMVFQSTIPVTLDLLFTKWQRNSLNVLAVGLALASGAVLYVLLRGKRPIRVPYLLTGGVMYAAFVVAAVLTVLL